MTSKHYSVIIAPSDGRKTYTLQVSRRSIFAIAAIFILLGSGVVFLAATYGVLAWKVRDREALLSRCERLEGELEESAALREEMELLREMDNRVRRLVGLPEREAEKEAAEGIAGGDVTDRSDAPEAIELEAALFPDAEKTEDLLRGLARHRGAWGWPAEGFVSSRYGEERGGGAHAGLDIAAPTHTVVETPLDGRVLRAGWDDVYGKVLILDHGGGLLTLYGHNASLLVRAGERVRKDDAIALVGNTGRSSAPHLHFEVRKDGYALDPAVFLKPKSETE
ncbi:MAG: M23 family metallopeptidase [Candidatus Eisenbacteria bacterium]|nr:M23 family metallopeptidase [Candidatus Eisenbacteria bacterium]